MSIGINPVSDTPASLTYEASLRLRKKFDESHGRTRARIYALLSVYDRWFYGVPMPLNFDERLFLKEIDFQ